MLDNIPDPTLDHESKKGKCLMQRRVVVIINLKLLVSIF